MAEVTKLGKITIEVTKLGEITIINLGSKAKLDSWLLCNLVIEEAEEQRDQETAEQGT